MDLHNSNSGKKSDLTWMQTAGLDFANGNQAVGCQVAEIPHRMCSGGPVHLLDSILPVSSTSTSAIH